MKFAFYVHKHKARHIANLFKEGALLNGHKVYIRKPGVPVGKGEIGVFYGVVPETFGMWVYYRDRGMALYLDNGFLNGFGAPPLLRFSWNGIQAVPTALVAERARGAMFTPKALLRPSGGSQERRNWALICLQSDKYFSNVGIGVTQPVWAMRVADQLEAMGYKVNVRPKPTKKVKQLRPLIEDVKRHGVVISANSAICLKAAYLGASAHCALPSTLTPICPAKIPALGKARALKEHKVDAMIAYLSSQEFTFKELEYGGAVKRMLRIPKERRLGINYD